MDASTRNFARLSPPADHGTGELSVKTIVTEWELDADLVVFSACQTALGRDAGGDGLLGFAILCRPLLLGRLRPNRRSRLTTTSGDLSVDEIQGGRGTGCRQGVLQPPVYASPRGSPRQDARLASGCWPFASYISPPFPGFAWRKRASV
jgi:CHAT domain